MKGTAGPSKADEYHESPRTFPPQEDDWNMDQQDGYFDAHVDHGFGSDDSGDETAEKEVIPSSDAEEGSGSYLSHGFMHLTCYR